MIQIWKETLLPGTQLDHKSRRPFKLTTRDMRMGEKNINRMVEKGRKIPLVWEHLNVEENDPEEWKAQYARNTFGWVGGARLSTAGDVEEGIASRPGTLLVRHDVYDEQDAKQLTRTGYVSPKIYHGYLDSQGEEYDGLTVAHVAASPTVCQWWQAPFPKELSEKDAFYLSYTPPEGEESKSNFEKTCPSQNWSFDAWLDSLDRATEMSATDTPEESAVPEEKEEPAKKESKGEGEGGGKNADLEMVVKAIKEAYPGAKISDKVSSWNELVIALESQSGAEAAEEPEEMDEETPESGAEGATTAAPSGPPMLMSTTDRDPRKQKQAIAYARDERAEAAGRIKACFKTGKIDGATQRKLLRQAEGFEMSFTDGEQTGKKWNALLKTITESEKAARRQVRRDWQG